MSIPSRRGPKPLSEILGELFTERGYGQFRARAELEQAWLDAVGETASRQTELGEVRRGVLNVTVAHPALLEELSAFEKPRILAALRTGAPGTTIQDIRFRVGAVGTAKVVDRAETRPKAGEPGSAAKAPVERRPRGSIGLPGRKSKQTSDGHSHGEGEAGSKGRGGSHA